MARGPEFNPPQRPEMATALTNSRKLDEIVATLALLSTLVKNTQGQVDLCVGALNVNEAKQEQIMAKLADVVADQATEDAEINALITAGQASLAAQQTQSAQIAALQAQIAAGNPVSEADLDPIKNDMDVQIAKMSAALAPAGPLPPVGATGATGATGAPAGSTN